MAVKELYFSEVSYVKNVDSVGALCERVLADIRDKGEQNVSRRTQSHSRTHVHTPILI